MDELNYTLGALWGGWLLFWLVSARWTKRTATRTGPLWRFRVLAAVLVVWLGLRQFPEYFRQRLLPPSAAWVYIGLVLTLCVFGMAAILLIVKLKAEEALLARQFPEGYLQYRRRVKALIPFLY
jgi:protein-S-isoprenylcysteine O-methyltransferase Ste14